MGLATVDDVIERARDGRPLDSWAGPEELKEFVRTVIGDPVLREHEPRREIDRYLAAVLVSWRLNSVDTDECFLDELPSYQVGYVPDERRF